MLGIRVLSLVERNNGESTRDTMVHFVDGIGDSRGCFTTSRRSSDEMNLPICRFGNQGPGGG